MKKIALKHADRGTAFDYAGQSWILLENDDGRALCLSKDIIETRAFDEGNCNNFAVASSKEYGDVVSRQPVDWWTGEPEPGLYIAPESFMEDLAAVKGKSNITIKINSCGGDLYTGIAIHNAIKGLTGHKVVVVEGIAASAASVIACAGDEVQVYLDDNTVRLTFCAAFSGTAYFN